VLVVALGVALVGLDPIFEPNDLALTY
jgi:hypothetical protein